ncbi:MAG: molybdopterin molybdotransferase MoeA [Micrococcales bacterium]|nr:molybdopterin molybdotransferase MoeA [Micrococcales bacterium]
MAARQRLSSTFYRKRVVDLAEPTHLRWRPLERCLGRVLAEPVHALVDVPGFHSVAMDGYAVRHDDDTRAGRRRVVGTVPAGAAPTGMLAPGQAARIMTGAPLPPGADAVVPVEAVQTGRDADGDHIVVADPVVLGQHVRPQGEDVAVGDLVLPAGRTLRAADLAAAAATGHARLAVRRRPRVAVVTTGDETQAPGRPLAPGQIYDSNQTFLAAALRRAGAKVVARRHCPDRTDQLTALFDELAATADLLLVAGGISAGDYDIVRDVLLEHATAPAGQPTVVHVAIRPGKPQAAGTWRGTPVLALPGNPVSVAASFAAFVRPWLDQALVRTPAPLRTARVAQGWTSPPGLTHLVPVTVTDGPAARTVRPATDRTSASHLVASLARADAWAVVPEDVTDVTVGTTVELLDLA